MPRTLLFLAMTAAGLGSGDGAPPPSQAPFGIPAVESFDSGVPSEALQSAAPVLAAAAQEGSAPTRRSATGRCDHRSPWAGMDLRMARRAVAFHGRATASLAYSASDAMARAGRLAFPATAPPPFLIV